MASRSPALFDLAEDSLLVLEGIDDLRFAGAFLNWLNKPHVQLVAVGGTSRFRPFLDGVLTKDPNFPRLRRLGIVRDADASAASAFQSVRDALRANSLVPPHPWVIAQDGQLEVSVAILPDGMSQGSLEDLCLSSIGDGRKLECVDQYLTCIQGSGPPHEQLSKARLHAYLAAPQNADPGLRLGEAADAGIWDWDSSPFQQLADFLRAL